MKLRSVLLGMTLSLSCLTATLAAGKADFSGVWVMDRSKAEGIPPDMNQKMRVRQDGDRLDVETDLVAPNYSQVSRVR